MLTDTVWHHLEQFTHKNAIGLRAAIDGMNLSFAI